MIHKNLALLFLILVHILFVNATQIDSLRTVLNSNVGDSIKIHILFQLGKLGSIKMQERIEYLDKAEELANKTNNIRLLLKIGNLRTDILRKTGKQKEALQLSNELAKKALEENDSLMYMGIIQNRGNIYKDLGEFEKAFKDYNTLIKFHELNGDELRQAKARITIAIVYAKNGHIEDAIMHLTLADSLLLNYSGVESQKYILELRNKINNNVGATYMTGGDFKNALLYFEKALSLMEYTNDQVKAHLIYNIGRINFINNKNYSTAFEKFKEALLLYKKVGNDFYIGSTYEMMAEAKTKLKEYDEAKRYALIALEYANRQQVLPKQVEANGILSDIYYFKGDYKEAFELRKTYEELKDSLFNERKTKAIKEIELKYKTEKNEAEIKNLNISNQLNESKLRHARNSILGLIVAGILFVLFVVYYIISFKKKKQAEQLHAQIASREELRGIIAGELHDKVCSDLVGARFKAKQLHNTQNLEVQKHELENLLKTIYTDTRNISKELSSPDWSKVEIRKYLSQIANTTGLTDLMDVKYTIHSFVGWDSLKNETKNSLSLIIREACINIIKHAAADNACFTINNENQMLLFILEDDGIGYKYNGQGNGIANMQKRIKRINGELSIEKVDNSGTKICIKLPIA